MNLRISVARLAAGQPMRIHLARVCATSNKNEKLLLPPNLTRLSGKISTLGTTNEARFTDRPTDRNSLKLVPATTS